MIARRTFLQTSAFAAIAAAISARGASAAEPEWNAAGMQLARVLVGSGRVDQGLEIARKQVAAGTDLSSRLDDPVLHIDGFHLYSFNQVQETETWRTQTLESLEIPEDE